MKKIVAVLLSAVFIITIFAQERLFIFKSASSVVSYLISEINNITFDNNETTMYVNKTDNSSENHLISEVDSLTLNNISDTVRITYSGASATIDNPLAGYGVAVAVSGADVVVTSTIEGDEVKYLLSGTATEGTFKIYSNYKFETILNGVSIANSDGPAINIQSSKHVAVTLPAGTTSTLADGKTYATSTEDQKGTFFSEGQLEFKGSGTLKVSSVAKHGICSDDYIKIQAGALVVTSAGKDGIHCKDKFLMTDGSVNITATGDGIECEEGYVNISGGTITANNSAASVKGITCDSTLAVSGGTINLTVSGNQSKGIKAGNKMELSGGNITVNTSGTAVLTASGSGYDPSYCTAVKCDSTITFDGATLTVTGVGAGNKGLSSDKDVNITSGTVKITLSGNGATYTNTLGVADAYSATGIDADGNVNITGGSVTVTSSGTAGKGISADGNLTIGSSTGSPVINVTNTGTRLLVSGTTGYAMADYSSPKCLKSDGVLTLANGTFTLSVSNPSSSCVDSDSTLYITGGTVGCTVGGNQSKGIKSTRVMTLSGGTITITATGGVELETSGSGYDPAYCAGLKSDSNINLSGSAITISGSGAAFKGVSSDTSIGMTSGSLSVTSSGTGTTYKNSSGTTDSYSSACLTSDGSITVTGGTLTTSTTSASAGGKGLKADGAITIGSSTGSPVVNITTKGSRFTVSGSDYCHPKTIVADGAISIINGTNTITSTDDGIHSETSITVSGGTNTITASSSDSSIGEGIESKSILISGGTNTITATNDGINGTYGTVSGGTESNDGSQVTISGGTTYVTGADAIDANGNFTMTGGIVFANGPSSGAEEFCDVNGTSAINGGIFVGCSSSQMQKAPSSTSSQPCLFISTTLSTSTMYTVAIAGTGVVSFKPRNGGGCCLVSTPQMKKGSSYAVYTGGSYSGGTSANNLYLNGTFSTSGATTKRSGTLSSSSTINSISF